MSIDRIFFWFRIMFIFLSFLIVVLSVFHLIDFNSPIAKGAAEVIEKETGVDIIFPGEKKIEPCLKDDVIRGMNNDN